MWVNERTFNDRRGRMTTRKRNGNKNISAGARWGFEKKRQQQPRETLSLSASAMIVFWLHQASSDRVEVSVCARRQLRDYGDATVETNIIAQRAGLLCFLSLLTTATLSNW